MKKWIITVSLSAVLLAVLFTTAWWIPRLSSSLNLHHETVARLNELTDLAWRLVGSAAALVIFVYGLWQRKTEARNTGGSVNISSQGPVSISAPVAARDVIISQTVIQQQASSSFRPLHQLPPAPADFTDREEELSALENAVTIDGVNICGILGQGGIGKTVFALKISNELASRFPDAQIYLNLQGFSQSPLSCGEAMAHVIRTLQPEVQIPDQEQELTAIYYSVLNGKKLLLLMDNARDVMQVNRLIPPSGCILLITSRTRFTLPGLRQFKLDVFSDVNAKKLFLKIAPQDCEEIDKIIHLVGNLPQAIRVAASALSERVDMLPSEYETRLEREQNRPKMMSTEYESIESTIGTSYNLLDIVAQRRWRTLAVFMGTFDRKAVQAVWELESERTGQTLGLLHQYSLLEWNSNLQRYRMHDLMRDFAQSKLKEKERQKAQLLHAKYYANVVLETNILIGKSGQDLLPGLARFDLERPNINAGFSWATEHAQRNKEAANLCSQYAGYGSYAFGLRQDPKERLTWLDTALSAARKLKNKNIEFAHLNELSVARNRLGDYEFVALLAEKAIEMVPRVVGMGHLERYALLNLGNAYTGLGRHHEAAECYQKSLQLAQEDHDEKTQNAASGNLATAYSNLGDRQRAVLEYRKQLDTCRKLKDKVGETHALANLGVMYRELGEYEVSIDCFNQSLRIAEEIGDQHSESSILGNMSETFYALGDREKAIQFAEKSVQMLENLSDPSAYTLKRRLETWRNA